MDNEYETMKQELTQYLRQFTLQSCLDDFKCVWRYLVGGETRRGGIMLFVDIAWHKAKEQNLF